MSVSARRRPYNARSLRVIAPAWKLPVPASQTNVGVEAVNPQSAQVLDWTFTTPVSSISAAPVAFDPWTGTMAATVPQLLASADGVTFVAPTSVTLVGGALRAAYPGQVLAAGAIFSVTASPAGVTFAGGVGGLALPQVGQVTAPVAAEEAAGKGEVGATPSLRLAGKSRIKAPRKAAARTQRNASPLRRAA